MSEHFLTTYAARDIEIVSGSGAKLKGDDGKTYIDLVAGIAVASLGQAHPALVDAISEQARRLVHVSNLYETEIQAELARVLFELTGGMRVFFCNSGAEAIECALKLIRKSGAVDGRNRIVCAEGAFHGRTFGALSATGQAPKKVPFEPLVPGFTHVPFGDADAVGRELEAGDVAAVMLEPIQGEAGIVVPAPGYLQAVRAACSDAGCLFVLDEVQTGVGRTGRWWAYEHEDATPDVMCIAKGLGGGLPIGACLARGPAADILAPGDHASTFGGGPIQCAAALAVLRTLESDGAIERAAKLGEATMQRLADSFAGCDVRGRGLMIGIDLRREAAKDVVAACADRGVLVNAATASVLRLTPPLVITEDEIDEGLSILEEVWREIAAA